MHSRATSTSRAARRGSSPFPQRSRSAWTRTEPCCRVRAVVSRGSPRHKGVSTKVSSLKLSTSSQASMDGRGATAAFPTSAQPRSRTRRSRRAATVGVSALQASRAATSMLSSQSEGSCPNSFASSNWASFSVSNCQLPSSIPPGSAPGENRSCPGSSTPDRAPCRRTTCCMVARPGSSPRRLGQSRNIRHRCSRRASSFTISSRRRVAAAVSAMPRACSQARAPAQDWAVAQTLNNRGSRARASSTGLPSSTREA